MTELETPEQIAERLVAAFPGDWDWIDKRASAAMVADELRAYALAQRERDAQYLERRAGEIADGQDVASPAAWLARILRDEARSLRGLAQ